MSTKQLCDHLDANKKSCGQIAMFHGMGVDKCWPHYSEWILSYRCSIQEQPQHPQIVIDFEAAG